MSARPGIRSTNRGEVDSMSHSTRRAGASLGGGLADLSYFVPERYAAYRPVVRDSLRFFLDRLPPQRLSEIRLAQLALPPAASAARRTVALLRQCPTLHKLGQVVARDARLPRDLRQRLQGLESGRPAESTVSEALAAVRAELGDRDEITVHTQALAEGSVAVVVPFDWRPRGSLESSRGVFKVLKTGVDELLAQELAVWSELGGYLGNRCAHYQIPEIDYRATFDSVCELLLSEVRLDREQANLARAGRFYADEPGVYVPGLLPFCTPRLTAMERVYGGKVTSGVDSPDSGRNRALRAARALVAKPFWSADPTSPVHGDPHAGNLFWTRDGRLALLDWSMTISLRKPVREQLVQVLIGALTLDEIRICHAVQALARKSPEESALRAVVASAVGAVRNGQFPGFEWTMGILDRAMLSARMGLEDDLVVFRKVLHTICGVLNDLAPNPGSGPVLDDVLLRTGADRFFREFGGRALAPFFARGFGSHLSNADLVGLWLMAPWVGAREWLEGWNEVMRGMLGGQPSA